MKTTFLALLSTISLINALPNNLAKRDTTTTFDGRTFINHGLVGFGRISASAADSYGETLGGLGSSIGLESLIQNKDGSFAGNIRLNPDRGHNTVSTTDYRARSHEFAFTFNPNIGSATMENIVMTVRIYYCTRGLNC